MYGNVSQTAFKLPRKQEIRTKNETLSKKFLKGPIFKRSYRKNSDYTSKVVHLWSTGQIRSTYVLLSLHKPLKNILNCNVFFCGTCSFLFSHTLDHSVFYSILYHKNVACFIPNDIPWMWIATMKEMCKSFILGRWIYTKAKRAVSHGYVPIN